MELSKLDKNSFQQLIVGDFDPEKSLCYNNISKCFFNLSYPCLVNTKHDSNGTKDVLKEFWLHYCDSINEGHNLHLSELNSRSNTVQLGYTIKLLFDMKSVSNIDANELIRSIDQYIQHIIGVIQSIINYYFESTIQKCEYIACYLRPDNISALTMYKNMVEYQGKIIFPYAHIRKEYIYKIYNVVTELLKLKGNIADVLIIPMNNFDTIIQPFNDQLTEMYGSNSDIDNDNTVMKLYEIYGFLNIDKKTTFEISRVFVPTLHSVVCSGIIKKEIIMEKIEEKGLKYWLPLFFSPGFYDVPLKYKEDNPEISRAKKTDSSSDYITKILSIISTSRVEEYWSWIDIGNALHTENASEKGVKLWKEITKRGKFKTETDCDEMWNTFDNLHVNLETLEHFASIDNPEKYGKLRQQYIDDFIDDIIRMPEHTQIARAFKACFPHKFICSNSTRLPWYYYNGKYWIRMTSNNELIYVINEMFIPIFEERQSRLVDKITRSRDCEVKIKCQNLMTQIGKIIAKLSKQSFKQGLCKELKIYYNNSVFNEIRNTNPCIHYAENGVIDTREGNYLLRSGKPQDYITKS